MTIMKTRQILIIFIGTLIFSLFVSSCATTQGARIESERRGFMLQDKSQYSRNKGKYNRGGSYDKYRKKNKRHIKKQHRK